MLVFYSGVGHIPPLSWLPSMLQRMGGSEDEVAWLQGNDNDSGMSRLSCSNYQRRAPCPVVNILRARQLEAATGGMSVVDLTVPDDSDGSSSETRVVKASGLRTYSRNAVFLAHQGDAKLLGTLIDELDQAYGAI